MVRRQLRNQHGASMVEYGLLIAVIAVIVVAGAILLGNNLNVLFNNAAGTVANPGG